MPRAVPEISKPKQAMRENAATKALQQAVTAYQSGNFQVALKQSDRVLAKAAQSAAAWQIKGLALFELGRSDTAQKALARAIQLAPSDISIAANAMEIFRKSGRPDEAIAIGEAAIDIPHENASFFANMGVAIYETGDLQRAKALHLRALEINPNHIYSLNNLGSVALDEADLDAAEGYYRQVIGLHPGFLDAFVNLATVLLKQDRFADTKATLEQLLSVQPNHGKGLQLFARLKLTTEKPDLAETLIRRAISAGPEDMDSFTILSQALLDQNKPTEAFQAALHAVALAPNSEVACHQAGLCAAADPIGEAAEVWYTKALALNPSFTPSLIARAKLASEHGNNDAARDDFAAARDLDPSDLAPIIGLCQLTKITSEEDDLFKALHAHLENAATMPPRKQAALRYALADAYHGMQQFDAAFAQYSKAAGLVRGALDYDASDYQRKVDAIQRSFTPSYIKQLRKSATQSARPMFIVGMPRSGTTLIESILASHSTVAGGGELDDLLGLFQFDANHTAAGFPESLATLDENGFRARIEAYLGKLEALDSTAVHVTDKMPSNFHKIGLIHALLPNAKIIHARRRAMDTCWSCLARNFDRGQPQTYEQTELAEAYLGYHRLMQHWQSVLPEDALLTVDYEKLVTDPRANTKALLKFCNLPWEDACLTFHTSKRWVGSASTMQVRQPIYTSSVSNWRNYESHLSPMITRLRAGGLEI